MPAYRAPDLGVDLDVAGEGEDLLVELATLAFVVEGREPSPPVFSFVQRLREAGFFAALAGGRGLAGALDAAGPLFDAPWSSRLSERLVGTAGALKRLAAAPGLLDRLRLDTDGQAALGRLRDGLTGAGWREAPFWVLRELVRLGVLAQPGLRALAVVPTPRLLRNAARIGLVPSADPLTSSYLVVAVQAVAERFGEEAGFGEALELLDLAL